MDEPEPRSRGPGEERLVSITIDSERTEYNVSGSDAVWAYGQAARLDSFLGNKGAVTQSPKYETKMSLAFVLFFLVVGAFFLLADSGPDTVSECLAQTRKAKEGAPSSIHSSPPCWPSASRVPSHR